MNKNNLFFLLMMIGLVFIHLFIFPHSYSHLVRIYYLSNAYKFRNWPKKSFEEVSKLRLGQGYEDYNISQILANKLKTFFL